MHKKPLLAVLISILALSAAAGAQVAGLESHLGHPDLAYTADMTFESGDGTYVTGKVYRAPAMERREMTVQGRQVVSIVRLDYNLVWLLVPTASVYTKTTVNDPLIREYLPMPEVTHQMKLIEEGADEVHGVATTRYRVFGVTQLSELYEGKLWVSGDGVVMRVVKIEDGAEGPRLEQSNVRFEAPPDHLFAIPEGYAQVEIDAGTLASLGGGSQKTADTPPGRGGRPGVKISDGEATTEVTAEGGIRVSDGTDTVEVSPETVEAGIEALGKLGEATAKWLKKTVAPADVECRPDKPCRLGSASYHALSCPAGGCEMSCGSRSNCTFSCPKGGCDISCGTSSLCEIDCPGGCDVRCGKASQCSGEW